MTNVSKQGEFITCHQFFNLKKCFLRVESGNLAIFISENNVSPA